MMSDEGGPSGPTDAGSQRGPGLIPALAFALVIIVALGVVAVLRQLIPTMSTSATATPRPVSTSAVPTVALAARPPATMAPVSQTVPAVVQPATPSAQAAALSPSPSAVASASAIRPLLATSVPAVSAVPVATGVAPGTQATISAPIRQTGVVAPATMGIPPIVYSYYDWRNTNFSDKLPQAGPVGSVAVFNWSQLHSGPNVYNWAPLDKYLSQAGAMTVTLQNGMVISKPVILQINENESEQPSTQIPHQAGGDAMGARFLYHDYTPDYVRRQITATLTRPITYTKADGGAGMLTDDGGSYLAETGPATGCANRTIAIVPKYDNPVWQKAYQEFVSALGARYDKNSQLVAVVFGPGIDGEYGQATKDYQGCAIKAAAYRLMPERSYLDVTVKPGTNNDVADVYRDAFPTKPLFFQFTSTGKDRVNDLVDARHTPAVALKQATLTYDANNQWQSNGQGTIQLMQTYSTTVPIAWENAYANTGAGAAGVQNRYFTILSGLSTFPAFMDFNGWIAELSADAPWLLDFTRLNLGRSITTTDQVWIGLRDTEYVTPTRGLVSYSGWREDAAYGLYRVGDAPLVRRAELASEPYNLPQATLDHPFSLMARRTDAAKGITTMGFAVDHRWPFWKRKPQSSDQAGVWYEVSVKYLDRGTDSLALVYQDAGGAQRSVEIGKGNTQAWVTTTVTLSDAYLAGGLAEGADLILDSGAADDVVHMVAIKGHAGAMPAALYETPVATSRTSWFLQQSAARATATALARLPGASGSPTANPTLWLPVTGPAAAAAPAANDVSAADAKPTVPPVFYNSYDWNNRDFGSEFPDYPPIGGIAIFFWNDIHLGPNLYNWGSIDSYLNRAQAMTVTMQDGSVISKPVIIEVMENESDAWSTQIDQNPEYSNRVDAWAARFVYHDFTPDFVKNIISSTLTKPITYMNTAGQLVTLTKDLGSYLVDIAPGTGTCITRTVGVTPKYNNATWQTYYKQMMTALGARYNGDPR